MSYNDKRLEELRKEIEKQPPLTAQAVKDSRDAFLAARDAVTAAELDLSSASERYGFTSPKRKEQLLGPLHDNLAAAKEAMLDARQAYDDIMRRGGATVEGAAHMQAQEDECKAKHQAAQEAQADLLRAEAKEQLKAHFIKGGGTEAEWETAQSGIWQAYLKNLALQMGGN